jgi:homoserine kinase
MNEVTIRVPGTTANLGPGFDCLGVALRIYNWITVRRGVGKRRHAMASKAAKEFFRFADVAPFTFDWEVRGDVPQSRGLGSSVTVRLGILHGLNELAGGVLSRDELFELCSQLEGHPDNAAPAEFGGFCVAQDFDRYVGFDVSPKLHWVLLIPEFEVLTSAAREVLPQQIPHRDAVESAFNACTIVAAFATRRYELLESSFDDYLHQPYREPLVPILPKVIRAAEKAGALGAYLSGSGSTIACVTLKSPEKVAEAIRKAAGKSPLKIVITTADNHGARVVKK